MVFAAYAPTGQVYIIRSTDFMFIDDTDWKKFHLGIVILGGCGTFTGLFFQTEESLEATSPFHYSFYFGWISGLLYIVAGSCTVVRGLSKYD